MSDDRPLFILAGNGPYENRGCEAIVRGTVRILREHFGDPRFVSISHFQSEGQYRNQCRMETDRDILHLSSWRPDRKTVVHNIWKPRVWKSMFQYHFDRDALLAGTYDDMLSYLDRSAAVLSVGGDNYTLDYGRKPALYTVIDDIVLGHGKPIILWGASVGPFSALPDYEREIAGHLRKVTGIFARESATREYLAGIGVTRNVYPVADPAFLLEPEKPSGTEDDFPLRGAIGLNLSPLMARYVTGGNMDLWTRVSASIISGIAGTTGLPVYLIPHVTKPREDDHAFMERAVALMERGNDDVTLVPRGYNAAQIKWVISQMSLFAGSRTHATIAALSSGVPTLSLGYSMKAMGINQDIFGHEDYCIDAKNLNAGAVAGLAAIMLGEQAAIRRTLSQRIPNMREAALSAGRILRQIIGAGA